MEIKALEDVLLQDVEKEIALYRKEAEEKIEKYRIAAAERLKLLKECYQQEMVNHVAAKREEILRDAKQKAERILLFAEKKMAERIYRIALSELKNLRDSNYGQHFQTMVSEVPPCDWAEVKVNPKDVELANNFFKGCHVKADDTVSGGFELYTADGRICVINSLEERLNRLLPQLLPLIFKEIYADIGRTER